MSNLKEERCELCENFDEFHGYCDVYKGFAGKFVKDCTKMKEKPKMESLDKECVRVEEALGYLGGLVKKTLNKVNIAQKMNEIVEYNLNLYQYVWDDTEVYSRGFMIKANEEEVIKEVCYGLSSDDVQVKLIMTKEQLMILLTTGSIEVHSSDMG